MYTFLDKRWAEENGIPLLPLDKPSLVFNVDRSQNKDGDIMHVTPLVTNYDSHLEHVWAQASTLGSCPLVLGYTYLAPSTQSQESRSPGPKTLSRSLVLPMSALISS
ncbi:hypothetical protein EDD16DRAFT_1483054 [Pisolithus croceorrhizus]|nr:hypothetical protein EDD16DRAFT_1483054 [Pisolithus croceorrhizus]KAI6117206.1 hypothetical protein EV401DRAFT_1863903 [Pisolithus croceorrhizus]KAI6161724.1 hypothetical protein EDD17DRAFT_1480534 [Pisolithus thermaeus]